MDREPVRSRALRSVGYDGKRRVLEIEFSSGRVYAYDDVSPETYTWLLRARNKGVFVSRLLSQHAYRDVSPAPPEQDLESALRASLRPTRAGDGLRDK